FLVTRQLRGMAHLDFLTGLPNRRAFTERMEAAWKRAADERRPLAIALVDVDWFKAYNDRYGHPAGDRVLRAVAQVLARHAGGSDDLVARLGGEEFVCVWPGAYEDAARAATDAIHADVAALGIAHAGRDAGRLSLSIGLHVLVPQPGQSRADALYQADQALYEAKAAGRNTTVVRGPGGLIRRPRAVRVRSGHAHAAVHVQHRARAHRGFGRGEEAHRASDVARLDPGA